MVSKIKFISTIITFRDFILESNEISINLHHWIDLIFDINKLRQAATKITKSLYEYGKRYYTTLFNHPQTTKLINRYFLIIY